MLPLALEENELEGGLAMNHDLEQCVVLSENGQHVGSTL